MTTSQRSLPRSQRSNKYSQEYAGRVVSRQSGTRRRGVIRLFHGAARYNQVFHAIDSLTPLSLSLIPVWTGSGTFLPTFSRQILPVSSISLHYLYFSIGYDSARNDSTTIAAESDE